ncbi:MAG: glycosyltransferase N-terminal domain-containing protein [Pseudomonadota bacterium]
MWIHAGELGNARAVIDLAQRFVSVRPGTTVLFTSAEGEVAGVDSDGVIFDELPDDHPELTQAFVRHWQPDVVVWSWGGLRPNLVVAASDFGAHMMLVDAASDGFERGRNRWLPEVPRRLLSRFHVFLARSQPAQSRLVQLGRSYAEIEISTPLRPFGHTLPAADSDIAELTEAFAGRPLWLAAHVRADEVRIILDAHRKAQKVSHRLLLILLVADPTELTEVTTAVTRKSLRQTLWSVGEMPDDNTQVLVADAIDELGLWLRVASVVFLGGSLTDAHPCHDPYPAAAHGTAILHGPQVGERAEAVQRLRAAGAALLATDAESLAQAVIRTSAPDLAAHMAMAGWDVTTSGAQSLDRIVSLVQNHLDAKQDGLA